MHTCVCVFLRCAGNVFFIHAQMCEVVRECVCCMCVVADVCVCVGWRKVIPLYVCVGGME